MFDLLNFLIPNVAVVELFSITSANLTPKVLLRTHLPWMREKNELFYSFSMGHHERVPFHLETFVGHEVYHNMQELYIKRIYFYIHT